MASAAGAPLRVAVLPAPDDGNPYQRLLHGALAERGVRFVGSPSLDPPVLREALADVDVVHLHWVEWLYAARGGGLLALALAHRRALKTVRALRLIGASRTPVVWTMHNLRPHDSAFPWLDRLVFAAVARTSAAAIVHSERQRAAARRLYPRLRVERIPIGSFDGAYPEGGESRDEVRRRLGIADGACLLLTFGQVRSYKRVPEAVRAFRAAAVPGTHLLVAGSCADPRLADALAHAAGGDSRVTLRLGFVEDGEVAALHRAADAALLWQDGDFSSAAVMLALSQGLPVLAPAGSTAAELGGPPAVVATAPGQLASELAALAAADRGRQRAAALAAAQNHDWGTIADAVRRVYGSVRRVDG
jgi:beta-1,4-mannosyltransferase